MPFGQSDADVIKERDLRAPEQTGQQEQNDPDVGYLTGDQGPFKCAHCTNYIDPNQCRKVAGDIDPEGCCNLYESIESNSAELTNNEGNY